jgi:hypothetical protein
MDYKFPKRKQFPSSMHVPFCPSLSHTYVAQMHECTLLPQWILSDVYHRQWSMLAVPSLRESISITMQMWHCMLFVTSRGKHVTDTVCVLQIPETEIILVLRVHAKLKQRSIICYWTQRLKLHTKGVMEWRLWRDVWQSGSRTYTNNTCLYA